MKIKIVMIEDQPIEAKRLKKELNAWSESTQFAIEINDYASGEEFFQREKSHTADIYFLDIQLGKMTGLDIAARLRKEEYSGQIVFLTAYKEYVFKGYEVHALNYLLKPVTDKTLFPCMNEIARELSGNTYVFRNKQEIIQIPYKDIITFSSSLHYVDILTVHGSFRQYAPLNTVISYLPKEFVRTHRSYIVNMAHIYKISGNTITLSNHMSVPIGRTYYKNVSTAFSEFSLRLN